jgi:hypothetical protein
MRTNENEWTYGNGWERVRIKLDGIKYLDVNNILPNKFVLLFAFFEKKEVKKIILCLCAHHNGRKAIVGCTVVLECYPIGYMLFVARQLETIRNTLKNKLNRQKSFVNTI